jgi:hypothetical protein
LDEQLQIGLGGIFLISAFSLQCGGGTQAAQRGRRCAARLAAAGPNKTPPWAFTIGRHRCSHMATAFRDRQILEKDPECQS